MTNESAQSTTGNAKGYVGRSMTLGFV